MDPTEFAALVARMRAKQREYFKTRDGTVLRESKDLERRVDAAIEAMQGKGESQPGLF